MNDLKTTTGQQRQDFIAILKNRFDQNMDRHPGIVWTDVLQKIDDAPQKLWSLYQMETTGGEPDVINFDKTTREYLFCDCAAESPKGRRSICYDREGLDSRKEFKPANNAVDMAAEMVVELLTEEQYRELQTLGNFDAKTSSWLKTPDAIRKLGGAIFGDYRYGKVFVYHNGAQSYYAARGFRAALRV